MSSTETHVEHRDALALEVRRHADDLADGDDAGAADAGDENSVGGLKLRQCRFPEGERLSRGNRARLPFTQPPALDRDEARAEALDAGEVLVARGLVDHALAAELGLERLDREAVGFGAAVAAAFAHALVDDGALGGIGIFVPLAPAALLRGAGLVVDER
jgi:hypothetical protein